MSTFVHPVTVDNLTDLGVPAPVAAAVASGLQVAAGPTTTAEFVTGLVDGDRLIVRDEGKFLALAWAGAGGQVEKVRGSWSVGGGRWIDPDGVRDVLVAFLLHEGRFLDDETMSGQMLVKVADRWLHRWVERFDPNAGSPMLRLHVGDLYEWRVFLPGHDAVDVSIPRGSDTNHVDWSGKTLTRMLSQVVKQWNLDNRSRMPLPGMIGRTNQTSTIAGLDGLSVDELTAGVTGTLRLVNGTLTFTHHP